MAENYETLEALINSAIDPAAAQQGVTATQHNAMLLSFLAKQGKWTGFPQTLYNHIDDLQFTGGVNLNGGAMNDTNITVSIAETDEFFGNKNELMNLMGEGSIILLRDYEGHQGMYKVVSHTITNPPNSGVLEVYHFVCTSLEGNSAYTPPVIATQGVKCVIELYPVGSQSGVWQRFDSKIGLGSNVVIPADEHNFSNRLYYKKVITGSQTRIDLRGYLASSGGSLGGVIFTIGDSTLNCNDGKMVQLSDEGSGLVYLATLNGNLLTAKDVIPDLKTFSIEMSYYSTNPSI